MGFAFKNQHAHTVRVHGHLIDQPITPNLLIDHDDLCLFLPVCLFLPSFLPPFFPCVPSFLRGLVCVLPLRGLCFVFVLVEVSAGHLNLWALPGKTRELISALVFLVFKLRTPVVPSSNSPSPIRLRLSLAHDQQLHHIATERPSDRHSPTQFEDN